MLQESANKHNSKRKIIFSLAVALTAIATCSLPTYPRPQMVRTNWMNLNGLWNYAITDLSAEEFESDGQTLMQKYGNGPFQKRHQNQATNNTMAEVSPAFKEAIRDYLAERSNNEPEFAVTLAKPQKNLDDCLTYILNQVKNSGQMGFADEDIYNMAVHYYLSKKIDRNGEAPIQVTISLKGVLLQTSVGHSIPATKWLAETERVRMGCTNSKGISYSKT